MQIAATAPHDTESEDIYGCPTGDKHGCWPTRRAMKAVRGVEGGVAVVDLDEPPGIGEVLDIRSTSICASDLLYLRFGTRQILGHELAGVREDGTPVVVEAIYGCMECEQCLSQLLHPLLHASFRGRWASPPTGAWPSTSGRRVAHSWCPSRRASMSAMHRWSSRRPCRGMRCGWPRRRRASGSPSSVPAHLVLLAVAGARRMGAVRTSRSRRVIPIRSLPPSSWVAASGPDGLYDIVVEAAGSAEGSLARCADLVAPGGTIVVLGVYFGNVELNWMPIFNREARVIPSLGYCRHEGGREMDEAAAMLAADPEIHRRR